jgi:chromosome segregation ATPase
MTDMSRGAIPINPTPQSPNPAPAAEATVITTTSSNHGWAGKAFLALAIVAVFAASLYQSSKLSSELSTVKRQLMQSDHQISDMQGQLTATTATNADAKREVSESVSKLNAELEKTRKAAAVNAQRVQYSAKAQVGKVMTELTAKNTELVEQIDQLKKDNSAKSSEVDQTINGIKTDVGDVKTEVASTKADLDSTKTDLRRAMGDMGVMSGLIATNSTELNELKKLGERNYVEFTLPKNGTPQKVGDVQMALKKTDLKRNRFTLNLLADDKTIEKKDKTVNEPVQFYTASMRQPYEVVINSVSKTSVKGYLSIPKNKLVAQR